jgi:hypothetical protein
MAYSDHYPFWLMGYRAICGIELLVASNPFYHQTTDVLDNYLTFFPFGTECARAAIGTVAYLARPLGATGIGEEESASTGAGAAPLAVLGLGPNPARSLVRLDPGGGAAPLRLELFDAGGRLVRRVDRPLGSAFDLDVSGLTGGVYFLRLDGAGLTRKLVVAR